MSLTFTDVISCDLQAAEVSDLAVVNAARLSFDEHHEIFEERDAKLIDFLLKNRHGSPFEHGYFKFRLEVPIAAFRDHVRHRAGHSYNEMSGRYTKLEPTFYLPEAARTQKGKPGQYYFEEEPPGSPLTSYMQWTMRKVYQDAWESYEEMLRDGVAKEQARLVLPVGIFTKVIWSCNPRSLMHFISLRAQPEAMKEIRVVAEAAEKELADRMPSTYDSFVRNGRQAP